MLIVAVTAINRCSNNIKNDDDDGDDDDDDDKNKSPQESGFLPKAFPPWTKKKFVSPQPNHINKFGVKFISSLLFRLKILDP